VREPVRRRLFAAGAPEWSWAVSAYFGTSLSGNAVVEERTQASLESYYRQFTPRR
jgi:hypothetical protein